jgi:hypothetical protein
MFSEMYGAQVKFRRFGNGLDSISTSEINQQHRSLANQWCSLNLALSARVNCRWLNSRFSAPGLALWQVIVATDHMPGHWTGQAATISDNRPEPDRAPALLLSNAVATGP